MRVLEVQLKVLGDRLKTTSPNGRALTALRFPPPLPADAWMRSSSIGRLQFFGSEKILQKTLV
jgi:hypothetical protein